MTTPLTGRLRVGLVGTAPPRRCGIATFTDDLRRALTSLDPSNAAVQVALTDGGRSYEYGADVVFEIQADQLSDYRAASRFIGQVGIDVLCVQHEFGIFGGPTGRYVDELLEQVTTPVVTTLHTVLSNPTEEVRAATRRLAERSDRLIVLADRAVDLLGEHYGISGDHVLTIPHGVPDAAGVDLETAKRAVGAEGRTLLMTFGLLSSAKGIEDVLDALPAVIAEHPDVLYVVLGATHPHVNRDHGESYRESLVDRVGRLGIGDHVSFDDRYVDLDELRRFLSATDIYVTPYHSVEQIVSGTLAYAVGVGCAVVSTPYPYAEELLADGRGRLVPFRDPPALGAALSGLLGDDGARTEMRRLAHEHGRSMRWPAVAQTYTDVFADVAATHERSPVRWSPSAAAAAALPRPSFTYLRTLTDDCGVFQHAPHAVPERRHGYCTDDVGRALVAAVLGADRLGDPTAAAMVPTFLSFLSAAQRDDGRFDNLLGFDRRFVGDSATEDTLGQAVWGLGTVVAESTDDGWRTLAGRLVNEALPAVTELRATKSVAYAICGLCAYLERFPGALAARRGVRQLADLLVARLAARRSPGWNWFDAELTYANAKVPESLLHAGRTCDEPSWVAAGLSTLDFLIDTTFVADRFDFVGNDGWFVSGGDRATFGQQPIEAGYTVSACVAAYESTGEERYLEHAFAAAEWLVGRNRLGVALYDADSGRCVDGLDRHGASTNAGAESTICAILGLLALPAPEARRAVDDHRVAPTAAP